MAGSALRLPRVALTAQAQRPGREKSGRLPCYGRGQAPRFPERRAAGGGGGVRGVTRRTR